jgi:hypothetical protein
LIGGGGNAMVGTGGWSLVTVSVALALVAEPEEFDTMHRNWSPSSPGVTDAIVYDDAFAPEMFELLRCHW